MKWFERLKLADWFVLFSILNFFAVHAFTQFYLSANTTADATEERAAAVVQLVEQNPFARWQFLVGNFSYVFKFILLPAFLLTTYWYERKKKGPEAIEPYATGLFMVSILNVFNDAGAVLGVLARKVVV